MNINVYKQCYNIAGRWDELYTTDLWGQIIKNKLQITTYITVH